MEKHTILEGKVRIYRRPNTKKWHCAARIHGKNIRRSTNETQLGKAEKVAEDWYFSLRGGFNPTANIDIKEPPKEKTFIDAAETFVEEYDIQTKGERNPVYARAHGARIKNHLQPFFGGKLLSEINTGLIQQYRLKRSKPNKEGKVPSQSTLHHEDVTLRLILKTALRHGWITHLPDFSAPYRMSNKVTHRGWFTKEEYKRLYSATREHAKAAIGTHNEYATAQLHDRILLMANTGLRPDEMNILEYRDVEIIEDEHTEELILLIKVRGKRGVGYCKSTNGAVFPFQRLVKRNNPNPNDRLFPQDHRKQFNRILEALDLREDREGNKRSFYSLRHSYISFRLLEGADIYQIAKNCRTSVEMIEKHYAVHLKNAIDASSINVRKRSVAAAKEQKLADLNKHLQ